MFCFGRKHGKGVLIDEDKKPHNVIYYHDMENLMELSSSRCWDCAGLNIFFTLCVIGTLFPAIYVNPKVFIATGVCYLLLLCETLCSQTSAFLSHILTPNDLQVYIQNLSNVPPHIKFWI